MRLSCSDSLIYTGLHTFRRHASPSRAAAIGSGSTLVRSPRDFFFQKSSGQILTSGPLREASPLGFATRYGVLRRISVVVCPDRSLELAIVVQGLKNPDKTIVLGGPCDGEDWPQATGYHMQVRQSSELRLFDGHELPSTRDVASSLNCRLQTHEQSYCFLLCQIWK